MLDDDAVSACAAAIITLGRGSNTELDEDRSAYATACAAKTRVLFEADGDVLAEAIKRLTANGEARFVADAMRVLARVRTGAASMGPWGTA